MKIEDIKFPIEVKLTEGRREYRIIFNCTSWLKHCCGVKSIRGVIKSRELPKTIKGFREREEKSIAWKSYCWFRFCPLCGRFIHEHDDYNDLNYYDIIREAWLKTIKNFQRKGGKNKW